MRYTERLRAEIVRLRDLLLDNGIDPEPPGPPAAPQFGPPTLLEWITHKAVERAAARFVFDQATWERNLAWWRDPKWPPGELRIRLPTDFTVKH